jgi:protein-disulfide isomerase
MKTQPIVLAVPPQPDDHRQGGAHARLTLIEYGDFESSACRSAAPTVRMLLDRHPSHLQVIYRHFPSELEHAHAVLAAEASEAAAAQGKFWEMHDALYRHAARLGPKDLHRYAVEIGMDPVRYTAEMDDHIYLQKVREHIDGARRSHLVAAPAFFIGGVHQDTAAGMGRLIDTIGEAVARER